MGHIERIADEQHLEERLQHYITAGLPESRLTVISRKNYGDFLRTYPGVNERMTHHSLEEILVQLDNVENLTLSTEERDNYAHALENGEILLYVDHEDSMETPTDDTTMELHKERLYVDKETVNAGEVVVEKHTESTVQEFDVPVNMEKVTVERRPVEGEPLFETYNNTDDSDDDLGVIRIPVTKERLKVIKEHVVTEEIVITKEVVEKMEHVSGTVQHDDIRVNEVRNEDIDK